MVGERHPAYTTLRLCDHAAVSAVHGITSWSDTPSALFMQPLQLGGTCIRPTIVSMLETFLLTLIKQARHVNALVRDCAY